MTKQQATTVTISVTSIKGAEVTIKFATPVSALVSQPTAPVSIPPGRPAADSAIVPYRLEKTLSPQGTVSRGVCSVKDGYLTGVDELTAIEKKDGRIFNTAADGETRELAPETPVSMNFWGFPPDA